MPAADLQAARLPCAVMFRIDLEADVAAAEFLGGTSVEPEPANGSRTMPPAGQNTGGGLHFFNFQLGKDTSKRGGNVEKLHAVSPIKNAEQFFLGGHGVGVFSPSRHGVNGSGKQRGQGRGSRFYKMLHFVDSFTGEAAFLEGRIARPRRHSLAMATFHGSKAAGFQ